MYLFKKEKDRKKQITRVNAEIDKAKNYLYKTHPVSRFFYGREPYHYVNTTYNGRYARYHFYKGYDKRLEYIVLSEEERKQKQQEFEQQMGKGYEYVDTIFSDIFGDDIQHRFISKNGERAYLTDRGTVGEGYLKKD